MDPPELITADKLATLARLADQHPRIRHFNETGDGSAHRISDFLDQPAFRFTSLYRELYEPMGVEYQMSITLPSVAPRVIAIAVSRGSPHHDFTERDRAVLDRLRPHLAQAYRFAEERDRLRVDADALGSVLRSGGRYAVTLDDPPRDLIPGALERLHHHFGAVGSDRQALPAAVRDWVADQRSRLRPSQPARPIAAVVPLIHERDGRRAVLRFVPGHTFDTLVLVTGADPPGGPDLERLGLTRREAEVLAVLMSGASTTAISVRLDIAPTPSSDTSTTSTASSEPRHVVRRLRARWTSTADHRKDRHQRWLSWRSGFVGAVKLLGYGLRRSWSGITTEMSELIRPPRGRRVVAGLRRRRPVDSQPMTVDNATGRMRSAVSEPEPDEQPRRRSSAAAPAAMWAFAFLLLRIFAVSGYDWPTAFAVSTTLGVDDGLALVFGSFMAEHLMVALLLVLILPLLICTYLWAPNGRRSVVALPAALGFATVVAHTLSFGTWWLPVVTATVLGAFVLARRRPPGSVVRRLSVAATAHAGWVAAMAALLAAVVVQTPWVPRERIETKNGTITGYVLSVDPGYLNVLTEDHEFVILISGDVLSRH